MSIVGGILGIGIAAAFLFMIYRLIGIPDKEGKGKIEKRSSASGTVSRTRKPDSGSPSEIPDTHHHGHSDASDGDSGDGDSSSD